MLFIDDLLVATAVHHPRHWRLFQAVSLNSAMAVYIEDLISLIQILRYSMGHGFSLPNSYHYGYIRRQRKCFG